VEDTRFELNYADDTLTVTAKDMLNNQTVKGQLVVTTDRAITRELERRL